jgi:hypothetical protein
MKPSAFSFQQNQLSSGVWLNADRVDGWQDNPIYGKLLSVNEQVKIPVFDESYESIPKTTPKK